jgi:hypothetical protein
MTITGFDSHGTTRAADGRAYTPRFVVAPTLTGQTRTTYRRTQSLEYSHYLP